MSISFADRIEVPDEVLISGLQGESVILNLNSERYFGLDEVGSRMLSVLNDAESIQAAFETLRDEYDVDDEILRHDLISIIEQLVEIGVVKIARE